MEKQDEIENRDQILCAMDKTVSQKDLDNMKFCFIRPNLLLESTEDKIGVAGIHLLENGDQRTTIDDELDEYRKDIKLIHMRKKLINQRSVLMNLKI